jgi:hypothetical protein
MIGCVVLWAILQHHLNANGVQTRSRGSLRYQRRKARRLGIDVEDVEIAPHNYPVSDYEAMRQRINKKARRLLIPTLLLWLMLLWPFIERLWK